MDKYFISDDRSFPYIGIAEAVTAAQKLAVEQKKDIMIYRQHKKVIYKPEGTELQDIE